ncbi:MAG TPA: LptA/OstA family protein [Candidatus Angelobacter sp.]|nr:LptA/OstA family protein [Candidatus Angelobacter sp.]
MPLDPKVLRKFFATGAVLAAVVATGYYFRGILRIRHQPEITHNNIPKGVEQRATGFTFSKSEGGRTLFTIRASSFEQFKEGQRYELHDASIILYGKEGGRSDQIFGTDFQYDKSTGDVTAKGEVEIDLEATSPVPGSSQADAAQATKSMVHLKTSGLNFNEKTGLAHTKEKIEFRVPDASGSAVGATYDSRGSTLVLNSLVKLTTTGRKKADVNARSATITRTPQSIVLHGARMEQPQRAISTDKLTVLLRDNNTVDRILGSGNVHAVREGPKGFDVTAPEGELVMDRESQPKSGTLSGGVTMASRGDPPAEGKAGRILLSFGAKGRLDKARAEDNLEFKQGPADKSEQIKAAAVDVFVRDGKVVEKALTSSGPAQIVLTQGPTTSTISAAQFEAKFSDQNRLKSVIGTPDSKIVSVTPGQPDRVTSSHDVTATFNNKGEIVSAEQNGDFRYAEGSRTGRADRARYTAADESYVLSGSPRITDTDTSLTADSIQLSRKNGSMLAQGNVKTTYNQKAQAAGGGAMLGSADPVHVTGNTMTATRSSGTARYTAARLWRGQDVVEAPNIVFDRTQRSLQAQADKTARVVSVFVQTDKKGKSTPVNVAADKLSYVDADRKAVFNGNVLTRIEGSTVTADSVQVLLRARGSQSSPQAGSQLDRIVALGDIQIEQPGRKATGNRLVYTGEEEKFVLTGSAGHPPSIFDAERGQITGDSLTFFTHDGRVLVGSGDSSLTLTRTKEDTSKK